MTKFMLIRVYEGKKKVSPHPGRPQSNFRDGVVRCFICRVKSIDYCEKCVMTMPKSKKNWFWIPL